MNILAPNPSLDPAKNHCGHPGCNGRHDASLPVTEMCPGAVERKRARSKAYHAANSDKEKAYFKAYYEAHRDPKLPRKKSFRAASPVKPVPAGAGAIPLTQGQWALVNAPALD
jgi:hypothetical protein